MLIIAWRLRNKSKIKEIINTLFSLIAHYWIIKNKQSHYFLCKLNRSLSKKEAYTLFMESARAYRKWIKDNGKKEMKQLDILKEIIAEKLISHNLYDYVMVNNQKYP